MQMQQSPPSMVDSQKDTTVNADPLDDSQQDVQLISSRYQYSSYVALNFTPPPVPAHRAVHQYTEAALLPPSQCPYGNFLKGVRWSPDGACLLSASDDNWLRIYDLPQDILHTASLTNDATSESSAAVVNAATPAPIINPSGKHVSGDTDTLPPGLRVHEGETIYDYVWYSRMSVADASSCCFASTSRGHPVHMWDACTGALRCTYRGYNDVDEVTPAYSLAFSPDGSSLYAGYSKCILRFDVGRPGRESSKLVTYRKKQDSLPGIISCMAFSPDSTTFAAGSYGRVVGLFDARTDESLLLLAGHKGGVTQVLFSRDGNHLYTGARQDPHILCWDVRYTPGEVYRMERDTASTNQRIQFDIEPCGRHLATGGSSTGEVKVFDLRTGEQVSEWQAGVDTINGLSFHPYMPLAATASGHRQYHLQPDSDSDSEGIPACAAKVSGSTMLTPAAAQPVERGASAGIKRRHPARTSTRTSAKHGCAVGSNAMTLWRLAYQHIASEAEVVVEASMAVLETPGNAVNEVTEQL